MMRGSLTVCGCTVYGVGIGKITREKTDGTIITGAKLTNEVAKANKQAGPATSCRAAVELNCGAYLAISRATSRKTSSPTGWRSLAGSFSTLAANGGCDRAQAMLIELGMKWVRCPHADRVPGKVLNRLEETTLE